MTIRAPAASQPKFTLHLPWILIAGGLVGLVCSLVLTHDQIQTWLHPGYHPACSLNPIISCGNVISSQMGHVFGLPAPLLGLIVFPIILTVGAVMLAGARFKRWFWLGLLAGTLGGSLFALWLFWLSLYQIHSLCPFCLVTDVAVYAMTWYITLTVIENHVIKLPTSLQKMSGFARRQHFILLAGWFTLLTLIALHHFYYYYGHHL